MSKFSIKSVVSILAASIIAIATFTTSAQAADVSGWQKEIAQSIAKKQTYPRAALRKEVEGKVKVEINVDREGNVLAHTIKASSGHAVLDREVPKLLKRVSPLPTPPAGVTDAQLTMTVPLAWALN